MRELLLVGSGSFLGGVCRYYAGSWVMAASSCDRFPCGTLFVNIVGCFVIGIIAGLAEHQNLVTASTRLFLMTGILGGFTTFSAFGLETVSLLRADAPALALTNIVLSVFGGILAVYVGLKASALF